MINVRKSLNKAEVNKLRKDCFTQAINICTRLGNKMHKLSKLFSSTILIWANQSFRTRFCLIQHKLRTTTRTIFNKLISIRTSIILKNSRNNLIHLCDFNFISNTKLKVFEVRNIVECRTRNNGLVNIHRVKQSCKRNQTSTSGIKFHSTENCFISCGLRF